MTKLAELISLKTFGDERGSLISLQLNDPLSFEIKRIYYIFNTKSGIKRGLHAHKKLKQILICTSGSCKITLDDGKNRETVELKSPTKGLFVGAMLWREMHEFSVDCVLMVLASEEYDANDYLRNYDEFKAACFNNSEL